MPLDLEASGDVALRVHVITWKQVKCAALLLARSRYICGFRSLRMVSRNTYWTHLVSMTQWQTIPNRSEVTWCILWKNCKKYRRGHVSQAPCFWFFLNCLNVSMEWLAILLCIQEESSSNLYPKCGYPDWGISLYHSLLPGKWRNI
jgi:hypothetical protein